MNFQPQHAPRFRPSDSSALRFWLWLGLFSLGGLVFVFAPVDIFLVGLLFVSLAQIVGSAPAGPERALKHQAFIALVVLGALVLVALTAAMLATAPTVQRHMPGWGRVLAGLVYSALAFVELHRYLKVHARVAAA